MKNTFARLASLTTLTTAVLAPAAVASGDRVSLEWRIVDREGFVSDEYVDLTGTVTVDLFLRAEDPTRLNLVGTGTLAETLNHPFVIPLTFPDAEPWQHPLGINQQYAPGAYELIPSLAFDSYFALGDAPTGFVSFIAEPADSSWGAIIDTLWYTTRTTVLHPMSGMGDDAYYARLLRITLPEGARVQGQLHVGLVDLNSGVIYTELLDVPPSPAELGAVDLDSDGETGAGDVAMFFEARSENDGSADLNNDGSVDLSDLRTLLIAAGISPDELNRKQWNREVKRFYKDHVEPMRSNALRNERRAELRDMRQAFNAQ